MKKQILIIFVSLFLLAPCLQAQDFWEQLPFPDTLDISCVAVNEQGHIFAGTITGGQCISNGVFRSTDSSQTWQQVLNTGTFAILSIDISANGAIYAGSNGSSDLKYLYKSNDNGNTWNTIDLPYTYNIPFIKCKGVDTVYLSLWSGGALLLRSFDGGENFYECFGPTPNTSEYISDIEITPDGTIYLSLMCYMPNQGGVFKSTNNGDAWQELGLVNNQVKSVEANSQGDVFIGVFYDFIVGAGGLYVLYHDSTTLDTCLYGPQVNGIAINSAGDIYAGIGGPDGIIVSKDNGLNFIFENTGLLVAEMGDLIVDSNDYIYALYNGSTPYLYRSYEPTVTSVPEYLEYSGTNKICVYPNPSHDILYGIIPQNISVQGMQNCYIFSHDGKIAINKTIEVTLNCFNLNIAGLAPGAYTVNVGSNTNYYRATFIKQ